MAQAQPTTGSWRSRNVVALGVVSFFTDTHSEAILALLPQFMANTLGLRKDTIGLIEGISEATASSLKIVSGWWSDRIGKRKPVVLAGYVLSTVVKPLLSLATAYWHVLAVRVADRIGKGVRTSSRDALVAESVAPEQRGRAFGFHRAMDTAGAVVGSTLALGLLALFGGDYRRVFLVVTVAGLAAVLTIVFWVRESTQGERAEAAKDLKREVAGSLPWFLAAHTVFSAGNFSYAFFLLRAQDVGVQVGLVPALYVLHNVVYAVAAMPAGVVLDRLGARLAQVLTYGLHVLTCAAFGALATPALMPFWFAVYGIELGALGACSRATAAGLISRAKRGTGMGLLHACEGGGLLVASIIGGWLWERTGTGAAPFAYGAALALLAALLAARALRPAHTSSGGKGREGGTV